ncbi:MAG: two-component system, OmpR family, sensor kinase [Pseudonocardiales bacterium]|nr:two-component system, OmpR family, sensor kinase [Pseudonocardiales bacterium]
MIRRCEQLADGVLASRGARSLRWSSRLLADVLVVAALCAVVVVLLEADTVLAALPVQITGNILTLSAAAVGAGSAILAVVVSRLLGEAKLAWVAAALVLYCVVVLPWATLSTANLDVSHRASRLVAYVVALVLLLLSTRPPRSLGFWGGWVIMVAGGVCALAALRLPDSAPLRWFVEGPLVTVAVLVGWTAAAVSFAVAGIRRQRTPWLRLGLGLVVLAIAQIYRVGITTPTITTNLAFPALRLVGLTVVLVGLAQMVQRAMATMRSEHWQQQEELAVAAIHMERAGELAAERDHELRNGLAGLAGITHLLSADTGGEDHERLKHAVLAELGRLHRILDGGEPEPDVGPPLAEYAVAPVLEGLVALRSGDRGPDLDIVPGLRACGESAVLAQVMTNLLANCDRHAPGAAVQVRARRRGADIVVEVRDSGPGLPPGADADALLTRGVKDESAGGSGLGLYISAQLLAREGGTVRLRTVDDPRGCLATVTVPAVSEQSPADSDLLTAPRA